jgi:hypothetical protein
MASTSVVLPWSTCATIATLRMSSRSMGTARTLAGGAGSDASRTAADLLLESAAGAGAVHPLERERSRALAAANR